MVPWYITLLVILYWTILFTHVLFVVFLWSFVVEVITKLLLVPILVAIISIHAPIKNIEFVLYIVALLFCFLGDILLELTLSWAFYGGLGSFSIAHIFFTIAHLIIHKNSQTKVIVISVVVAILLAVGALVGVIFLDGVLLAFAVGVYVFALCFMTGTAWLIHPVSFLGGVFFIASDLLIGLEAFFVCGLLPWLSGFIMFFYGTCLFFLIWGMTLHIRFYHTYKDNQPKFNFE